MIQTFGNISAGKSTILHSGLLTGKGTWLCAMEQPACETAKKFESFIQTQKQHSAEYLRSNGVVRPINIVKAHADT